MSLEVILQTRTLQPPLQVDKRQEEEEEGKVAGTIISPWQQSS